MTEVTKQMIVDILEKPDLWAGYSRPEWCSSIRGSWVRKYKRDGSSSESRSALYYAACLGLDEIVRYLLRQDSEVNEEGGLFGNALQVASSRSHVSVVMTLLQHGANVNQQRGLFGSAINAACFAGNLEIVEYLITKGARAEYEGALGTSLDILSKSKDPNRDIVMRLIQNDALSGAKETTKCWLMWWAAISGHEDVLQLLINKMPINSSNSFSSTVYNSWERCHQLYQPKVSALYQVVFEGHEGILKLLIKLLDSVDEADGEGRGSLYWACPLHRNRLVQMLLDHGAVMHQACPNNQVARYWATLINDQEMLRFLNVVCHPSCRESCATAEQMANSEDEAISASALAELELDE